MNTWILRLDNIRRRVKRPRDYTVADWFMLSTVGLAVAAIAIGGAAS